MVEPWENCPLPLIEKSQRVKHKSLAPCRGGCNRYAPIEKVSYQLCNTCIPKYRYYDVPCDTPNCSVVGGNGERMYFKDNKFVCNGCYKAWKVMNYCPFEQFVESRHAYLARPQSFQKALELGVIEKRNYPVNQEGECQYCGKLRIIRSSEYQLCGSCHPKLRFYGETCSIKGCQNDAYAFDNNESRLVCAACKQTKQNYNLTSYAIYESQIRTITECNICSRPISHNIVDGKDRCSAYIDHDHETGKTRGVLCHACNSAEGLIKKTGKCPEEWAKNLLDYYENPPLTKSWAQES